MMKDKKLEEKLKQAGQKIESFIKILRKDTYQRKHETVERDEPVKNRTGTTDKTEQMENKTSKNNPITRTTTETGLQILRK